MFARQELVTGARTMSGGIRMPGEEGGTVPVETRLYLEEFAFLRNVYGACENDAPKFAFPDLISACVSLVFAQGEATERLVQFVRTNINQRNRGTRASSRSEGMWHEQFELLRSIQMSPANRYPNPKFSLGDFTSACVALVMAEPDAERRILEQARVNFARRTCHQVVVGTGVQS
jgi:hypothetical protein